MGVLISKPLSGSYNIFRKCVHMEVGIREFRGELKRYFDIARGEDVNVSRRGEVYTLRKRGSSVHKEEGNSVHKNVVTKKVIKSVKDLSVGFSGEYGCGCKREDGEVLCSKHRRV